MMAGYYCDEAKQLAKWAREETNRIKSSKLNKVAQSLEERYRLHHQNIVTDPYRFPSILPPIPPGL